MRYLLTIFSAAALLVTATAQSHSWKVIPPSDTMFRYLGRIDSSDPEEYAFYFPGIGIQAAFTGSSCFLLLGNENFGGQDANGNPHSNYYNVFVDDSLTVIEVPEGDQVIKVAENLKDTVHRLRVYKRTEALCGRATFRGVGLDPGAQLVSWPANPSKLRIEFIGNSITCGYGNEGADASCGFTAATENNYMSYGSIAARNLNAEYMAVAYSGKGVIQNYDQSTEETLPEIYQRINPADTASQWDFALWKPDIVVINLGTNDFAHALPDSVRFVTGYANFLKRIAAYYPGVRIVCLMGPMINDNWPPDLKAATVCRSYIKSAMTLAATSQTEFFEMSTQGAYGFGCDYHPNVRQHQKNAEELSAFIRNWLASGR